MSIAFGQSVNSLEIYLGANSTHNILAINGGTSYNIPNTLVAGDYIIFMQSTLAGGMFSKLEFDITTPISGTLSGVWEYATYSGNNGAYNWQPLQNVVDNTNNFQNSGNDLIVSFDRPIDWSNRSNEGYNTKWYRWCVRYRITAASLSTPATISKTRTYMPNFILSGVVPHTFEDIYQYDLTNSIGMCEKFGDSQYILKTTVVCDSNVFFISINEYVFFTRNHGFISTGPILMGEYNETHKQPVNGSTWIFETKESDRSGLKFGGENSNYYNSEISFLHLDTISNGGSNTGVGEFPNQVIENCNFFGWERYGFRHSSAVLKNININKGHIEPPSAILIDITGASGQHSGYMTRTPNTYSGSYFHRFDVRNINTAPSNPWQPHIAGWNEHWVDLIIEPDFDFNKFVYWRGPSPTFHNNFLNNCRSYIDTSVVLNVGVANSNITIKDKHNNITHTLTSNADGYVSSQHGSISNDVLNTNSYLKYTGFVDTNLRFKEILFTNGVCKGERSVIVSSTTDYLTLAEPLSKIPNAADRFIIIPYINYGFCKPDPAMPINSLGWSIFEMSGPYTFIINKPGYKTSRLTDNMRYPINLNMTIERDDLSIDMEDKI